MRSLILLMLLALVPFRYAEALDDINTLDLNEGIDFTKPDMNEDAKGYRNEPLVVPIRSASAPTLPLASA